MITGRFGSIGSNKEFLNVYKNAKKWYCGFAVVYFLEDKTPKLAVVASKKIGKAVVRNRTKRVLRSAFFGLSGELKDGLYVLVARTRLEELPYEIIQKDLKWSFKKVDCIK